MADNDKKFTGADRAAILLMALGEKEAADVLRHMGPKEVQMIGGAMSALSNVSKPQVQSIVDEFVSDVAKHTSFGIGNDEYVRKVLVSALGEDKAGGLIDRILLGRNSKGLEALKWMDPKAVAEVIRLEHPQIISIVLAHLESDHAAAVLSQLPERSRADILMRIATLDGVPPNALNELDYILEKQFSGNSNVKSSSVGGLKSAANILNLLDGAIEAQVMDNIRSSDTELGDKIEELMFVFEDIADLSDQDIRSVLKEISQEMLIIALKGADKDLQDKVFKNMSKRAAEMLRDDLEAKGPVRLSEVEAAQKEILAITRRLADSGEITLGGAGEEYV